MSSLNTPLKSNHFKTIVIDDELKTVYRWNLCLCQILLYGDVVLALNLFHEIVTQGCNKKWTYADLYFFKLSSCDWYIRPSDKIWYIRSVLLFRSNSWELFWKKAGTEITKNNRELLKIWAKLLKNTHDGVHF